MVQTKKFLFAIDLEDVRLMISNGATFKERVPINTYRYLDWLKKNNFLCTFFVTGNVATLYPSLIKDIISEGHEIACHTNNHTPLYRLTPDSFKRDIITNKEILIKCGASEIEGFRAPVCSLTEKTSWTYKILNEEGFKYSSSVLPARNPLHGWKEFGNIPRLASSDIFEIPLSVAFIGPVAVPFCGGIYFRSLPYYFLKRIIKKNKPQSALVGYLHPYDIDTEQEHFMHPEIKNNRLYNFLMYYNRSNVFERLNFIIETGYEIITYKKYVTVEFKK